MLAIVGMMNLLILPAFSIKRALANLHGTAARAVAQANAWAEQVPNEGYSARVMLQGVFSQGILAAWLRLCLPYCKKAWHSGAVCLHVGQKAVGLIGGVLIAATPGRCRVGRRE